MKKKATKKHPELEYDGDMIVLDDTEVSIEYLDKLYQKKEPEEEKKKDKKERTH